MFGKPKYQYTCADVIHDQQVAKRNAKISLGVTGIIYGGLFAIGYVAQKRAERKPDLTLVPEEA